MSNPEVAILASEIQGNEFPQLCIRGSGDISEAGPTFILQLPPPPPLTQLPPSSLLRLVAWLGSHALLGQWATPPPPSYTIQVSGRAAHCNQLPPGPPRMACSPLGKGGFNFHCRCCYMCLPSPPLSLRHAAYVGFRWLTAWRDREAEHALKMSR